MNKLDEGGWKEIRSLNNLRKHKLVDDAWDSALVQNVHGLLMLRRLLRHVQTKLKTWLPTSLFPWLEPEATGDRFGLGERGPRRRPPRHTSERRGKWAAQSHGP